MKKFIKMLTAMAVTVAIIISLIPTILADEAFTVNEYSRELDDYQIEMYAEGILYGQNYTGGGYFSVKGNEYPVTVKINPDNTEQFVVRFNDFGSKQKLINTIADITKTDIAEIKNYGDIHNGTIFDDPNITRCTECPSRALERAKGTFYQDYIYDYWKQYNEIYAAATGHNIPSVEKFFAAEGIVLNTVTATPTPVPTTPPKVVDKINSIKAETDIENTLLVINADNILTLAVNGEIVDFPDTQPFIDAANRTQIPVRAVAETFNCDVNWDGRISTAIISGNGKLITIAINSNIITVNGVNTEMDTIARLKNDRTCVPVRYIAEALGLTVIYETV